MRPASILSSEYLIDHYVIDHYQVIFESGDGRHCDCAPFV